MTEQDKLEKSRARQGRAALDKFGKSRAEHYRTGKEEIISYQCCLSLSLVDSIHI
jgi:hypothetical protein